MRVPSRRAEVGPDEVAELCKRGHIPAAGRGNAETETLSVSCLCSPPSGRILLHHGKWIFSLLLGFQPKKSVAEAETHS